MIIFAYALHVPHSFFTVVLYPHYQNMYPLGFFFFIYPLCSLNFTNNYRSNAHHLVMLYKDNTLVKFLRQTFLCITSCTVFVYVQIILYNIYLKSSNFPGDGCSDLVFSGMYYDFQYVILNYFLEVLLKYKF